uniref:Transmembrane protein n=1 Tax=Anopheles farauti TaxID=69004 RepID=A0A182QVI9_9DIPT
MEEGGLRLKRNLWPAVFLSFYAAGLLLLLCVCFLFPRPWPGLAQTKTKQTSAIVPDRAAESVGASVWRVCTASTRGKGRTTAFTACFVRWIKLVILPYRARAQSGTRKPNKKITTQRSTEDDVNSTKRKTKKS